MAALVILPQGSRDGARKDKKENQLSYKVFGFVDKGETLYDKIPDVRIFPTKIGSRRAKHKEKNEKNQPGIRFPSPSVIGSISGNQTQEQGTGRKKGRGSTFD